MTPRSFKVAGILALLLLVAGVAVCRFPAGADGGASAAPGEQWYTCGMHPQVLKRRPGDCPICGMKLTPVRRQPGRAAGPSPAGTQPGGGSAAPEPGAAAGTEPLSIDPVTIQNMGLRTGVVTRGPLRRTVRTLGTVDFDETALADVTTKFRGWIEKLYVDSTGKQAHQGEPLFEIYSPDLVSAQTEYVIALNQAGGSAVADPVRLSALTKLRFFDISDEQIAELERTGQPKKTLRVSAPRDGVVVEKMAVQGQMVEAGMKLYRLADLSIVWVLSQVYEQDLPFVRLGQEATVSLSYLPDRKFRGRVTYIYPTVDDKTRTARIRMEFHNPGFFLKPGMFATVDLTAELSPAAVLVPDMAVLRSGEKNTVFVALAGGRFEPRQVILGARSEGNLYEVIAGLSEGERVVTSGQFMLDSESQLREAIEKMRRPEGSAQAGSPTAATAPAAEEAGRLTPATTGGGSSIAAYICPMPEHLAIRYDKPGKCPICGMTLVPVSAETLLKLQPGGRVLYYTCPMPEHGDVRADKAGKCVKCGMTLIPVMEPPHTPEPAAEPGGHEPPARH